jgi:hypothetical protein
MTFYDTITEAVDELKERGYEIDFNLGFNRNTFLPAEKFKITEVHRFEGNTDPDDEAVVYAIESADGKKGILVNGYGVSSDSAIDNAIRNINFKH